jgi:hypothetical protein
MDFEFDVEVLLLQLIDVLSNKGMALDSNVIRDCERVPSPGHGA